MNKLFFVNLVGALAFSSAFAQGQGTASPAGERMAKQDMCERMGKRGYFGQKPKI